MKLDDLKTCLALGKTKKSETKLGRYGFGLKRVLPTLGDIVVIRSKYSSSKAYYLKLQFSKLRNFLDIESGELTDELCIPPFKLKDFDPGTEIEVRNLNFSSGELNFDRVKRYLQLVYGPFIQSEQMIIKFNGEFLAPSKRDFQPVLSFLSDEEIKKYKFKVVNERIQINLKIGAKPTKTVTGFVAFLDKRSTIGKSGFNLYRHGRLIKPFEKIGYKYHAETGMIYGELHLDDFPATFTKQDFVRNSPEWIDLVGHEVDTSEDENDPLFRNPQYEGGKLAEFLAPIVSAARGTHSAPKKRAKKPKISEKYLAYKKYMEAKRSKDDIERKFPWLIGFSDAIRASKYLKSTELLTKNRLRLILLDSCIEIACKTFLSMDGIGKKKLQNSTRSEIHNFVIGKGKQLDLQKINHYYGIRCTLYHESNLNILDPEIEQLHDLTITTLVELFGSEILQLIS